jgi:hypothetical protein
VQPCVRLLHFDPLVGPVVLEDDVDRFDHLLARIGLAMDDDLVLQRSGTGNLHDVFLGKAVVPTAVPGGQIVREGFATADLKTAKALLTSLR